MKDQRDILEVLRDPGYLGQQPIFARAADEIERLREALEPFVRASRDPIDGTRALNIIVNIDVLRNAERALTGEER